LTQTYEDFELIICDNASTDRTGEIARCYAARDKRIRYARNETNLGAGGNFRRTFELSSGAYFRWAAADDLSAPQSLARCVEVLDREPAVVLAYPKTRLIDEQGRVISNYDDRLHLQAVRASERFRQVLERLAYCNAVYGLMRADVLKRTRLLGDFLAADVVFQAELSLYGQFWEVPEFLFYRRFHPGASSSMDRIQLRVFWDPNGRRRIYLREWRHVLELARAVARAPLAATEKMRASGFLVSRAIWGRDKLGGELLAAMREVAAGFPSHHPPRPSITGRVRSMIFRSSKED
jgi:glycosyltransferase involved in cell wall biosynthesis